MILNKLLAVFAVGLTAVSASASLNLTFQAGVIRAENGSQAPTSSIGILVADTNGDGFGTANSIVGSTLTAGSSLGGSDNLIVQVFQATDLGGGNNGFYSSFDFTYSGTFNESDKLALYWFPTITTPGFSIGVNVNYGFYRSDILDPNSGSDIAFVAPGDGFSWNLGVFDNDFFPGTATTVSNLTALNYTAVPEPSSVALLAAGGALVAGRMLRRRKNG